MREFLVIPEKIVCRIWSCLRELVVQKKKKRDKEQKQKRRRSKRKTKNKSKSKKSNKRKKNKKMMKKKKKRRRKRKIEEEEEKEEEKRKKKKIKKKKEKKKKIHCACVIEFYSSRISWVNYNSWQVPVSMVLSWRTWVDTSTKHNRCPHVGLLDPAAHCYTECYRRFSLAVI